MREVSLLLKPCLPCVVPSLSSSSVATIHNRSLPPRAHGHPGQRLLFWRNSLRSAPNGTISSNPDVLSAVPLSVGWCHRDAVQAGNGRSPRTGGFSLMTDPQPPTSRDLSTPCPQQARGPRSLPAQPRGWGGGGPGVRIAPATGGGPGGLGVWAAAAALTSGGSWAITAATRARLRLRGLRGCSIYVGGRQDGGGGEENVGVAPTGRRSGEEGEGGAGAGGRERGERCHRTCEAGAGGRRAGGGGGGGGWRSRAGCRSLACHPCGAARARARRWSESRRAATRSHLRRAVRRQRRSRRRTNRPATALPGRSRLASPAGPSSRRSGSPPGPSRRRCRRRRARAGGRSRRRRGRRSRSARRSAWRWCWRTPPRRAAWSSATRSCCCAGTRGYGTSPSPSSLPSRRHGPRRASSSSSSRLPAAPALPVALSVTPCCSGVVPVRREGGVLEGSPAASPSLRAPPGAEAAPVPVGEGEASHLSLGWPRAPGLCCGLRRGSATVSCAAHPGSPPCCSHSLPGAALVSSRPGSSLPAPGRNSDHAGLYSGLSRGCGQVNKESPTLL